VVRAIVFSRQQPCCPLVAALFDQLLLPARWNNLVYAALFPMRSVLVSITYPSLGDWPVTPPMLSTFVPLLTSARCKFTSSRRLTCCPAPTLSLCCLTHIRSLRVWLLAPPPFSRAVQCSTPTSSVSVRLQLAVYVFQLCWGGFSLPRGCAGLCSWGIGRRVVHGAQCSPVCSADSLK
jgi:hypothetical protein